MRKKEYEEEAEIRAIIVFYCKYPEFYQFYLTIRFENMFFIINTQYLLPKIQHYLTCTLPIQQKKFASMHTIEKFEVSCVTTNYKDTILVSFNLPKHLIKRQEEQIERLKKTISVLDKKLSKIKNRKKRT